MACEDDETNEVDTSPIVEEPTEEVNTDEYVDEVTGEILKGLQIGRASCRERV